MTDPMAGLDLHSNKIVAGLVDLKGARVAHRKLDCKLSDVVEFLAPYRKRLSTEAVESTTKNSSLLETETFCLLTEYCNGWAAVEKSGHHRSGMDEGRMCWF